MTRSEKINLLQAINIGQANIESLMPKETIIIISMDEAEQNQNLAKIALLEARNKHRAPDNPHHVVHVICPPGD
jgi:hypothetical protein